MPPKRSILNWGRELGPYPSITKINFWMHWDLVWDLVPDPSTFFRIWIRRHRGGVNTWNIEISFEGTLIESKARAWLRLRISIWDLIRDADREEHERKSLALEDRVLHSRSLARSIVAAAAATAPRALAHRGDLHSSRGPCRCGLQTNTLSVTCSLDPCFFPKGYLRKLCNSFFYDFHEGFWVRHRCFSFSESWGKGIGRRGMYNSYCY